MKPARQRKRAAPVNWSEMHRRLERVCGAIGQLDAPERAEQERILRQRAAGLARSAARPAPDATAGADIEVLVFQLAGERYALETAYIAQACPMLPVTVIPGVPDFVVGVTAFQGEVLSVIDLRSLLDLPLARLAEPGSIIVLRSEAMEFGILAEGIAGIVRYPSEALQADLPALTDRQMSYLKGVTADRTAVLDAAGLLSDPTLIVEIN